MPRVSMKVITEMPIAEPMLRDSDCTAVAFAAQLRRQGGVGHHLIGLNTRPTDSPCIIMMNIIRRR